MNANTSIRKNPARHSNYRLRIQPVRLGPFRNFQVRIGMKGDNTLDYIPVYRSAFARTLQVEVAHADRSAAATEAQMLAEILDCELQG